MKTTIIIKLLLLSVFSTSYSISGELPSVLKYSLNYHVFPLDKRLEGKAEMVIHNAGAASCKELPFMLYRLMKISSVTDTTGHSISFTQGVTGLADEPTLQVNSILIQLPDPLTANASLTVIMAFEGYLFGYPEVMDYVHDHIDTNYTLLRTDAFAYPVLAPPNFHDIILSWHSKFTYDLEVRVPAGYAVACGGLAIDTVQSIDTVAYKFKSKVSINRIDIGIARYTVLRDPGEMLSIYTMKGDEAGAGRVLEQMKKVIRFYSTVFGPAKNYQGYTAIEIPDGWGSQAGAYYFLQTSAAFRDSTRINEVYHEIGHTWNAKPASSIQRCRYFDEAFASYFEALSLKEFYGNDAFRKRINQYRDSFVKWCNYDTSNSETPIASYGEKELGRNSYTKGAWSLYVLNEVVGDTVFRNIIHELVAEYADTEVDFSKFQKLAEKYGNRSLKKYFDEWIYGIESSRLMIDDTSIDEIVKRYK